MPSMFTTRIIHERLREFIHDVYADKEQQYITCLSLLCANLIFLATLHKLRNYHNLAHLSFVYYKKDHILLEIEGHVWKPQKVEMAKFHVHLQKKKE